MTYALGMWVLIQPIKMQHITPPTDSLSHMSEIHIIIHIPTVGYKTSITPRNGGMASLALNCDTLAKDRPAKTYTHSSIYVYIMLVL